MAGHDGEEVIKGRVIRVNDFSSAALADINRCIILMLWGRCNWSRDIWGQLWFSCGIVHRGKNYCYFSIFLGGRGALGYHPMKFRHFPKIS